MAEDTSALPAKSAGTPVDEAARVREEQRAIWNEQHLLTKARREEMARVMAEYDKTVYHPARRALQARCAAIGHNMQFTHTGPLGDPWFSCHTCGASECRREGGN